MPDEYGKWNSVFRRYRPWATTGVFEAMLEMLAGAVERDASADMIDSTIVRAHHCAVGIKKGSTGRGTRLVARRVHHQAPCQVRCPGPPARLHSDAWTGPRCRGLRSADAHDRGPDRCSAGRQGLYADAIRQELADAGIEAVIPARRNRRDPAAHDRVKYRWRNRIERLFGKLKNWRRVATRYDKTADSYLGFVSLVSALLWLSFVHVA